jgi:putative endopeptidase
MLRFILVLAGIVFVFSCSKSPESGIEKDNMDTSVRPQDDLYQFVNGIWLEKVKIPADKSNYGAFSELIEVNEQRLRKIIEEAANPPEKAEESEAQKVGDFYLSFMDSSLVEELGLTPLQSDLQRVATVKSKKDLVPLMAYFIRIGVQTPFYYYINQDQKQSDQYISYFGQSGLGLPDRDYYFKIDDRFKEIRQKYTDYISDLLSLANVEHAGGKAARIMEMETALASGHWTRVENRNRDKTYNKYTIKKLENLTPQFSWSQYIQEAKISQVSEVIVRQPNYFKKFNEVLSQYSVDDWKDYFTFRLLDSAAPYLSRNFVDLNFDFHGKTLSGIEELSPRWKRAVNSIDDVLGEAVGKLYVEKYFKPEAKQRMVTLVENLQASYKDRIAQLDWMSPETKEKALVKLSKFRAKVGYPDKWKDYSALVIKKTELLENMKRASLTTYDREIDKLGKPIDRDEWFMTPQTVNAYYNPSMNEVVFPAAILQPPFFNMNADDAVNYGAIGAVIGHEMTHGFDDQGRKSDGDGNLTDWWTEADKEKFQQRAEILVKQFNNYVAIDTFHINGQLTLGENIADLGGLTISYNAYQLSMKGKQAPVIDSWTGDERFFLGWAQIWRRKYRDDELRKRLLTDPHSPSRFRVKGPLVNMPEFYSTFNINSTDKMFIPETERVQIW